MPGNEFRLDPDFRKLWIGQAISQIGSNITSVGLPLTAVLVLKASPLQMGFLSGVGAAAVLILASSPEPGWTVCVDGQSLSPPIWGAPWCWASSRWQRCCTG